MRDDAGLTLVEMLAVLAIIGVAAGGVTIGIGAATRTPSVESEARRLAGRLEAAGDDAMLGDRLVALTADDGGYGFARVAADGTTPVGAPVIDRHALPAGMTLTLDGRPPHLLGLDGVSRPLTATLTAGGRGFRVRYDGLSAGVAPVVAP